MDDLFRNEAMQAQHSQALGTIRLASPISHQVWGLCAICITLTLVAWLCLGHYTRREHVAGSLVPQAGLLTLAAPRDGTVARLDVSPGAQVKVGQVLMTIAGDENSAAWGNTDAAIAKALKDQQAQIRATLTALPEQTLDQSQDLRHRIAMLTTQIHQIQAQLALQHTEAAMDATLVRKMEPLSRRGFVSVVEMDQYKAQVLNVQAQIKALARQRLTAEQQRSQLRSQLQLLPVTAAATAHQLRGKLAQLVVSMAKNDVARDAVLRATRAGTIASVLVKPGQMVKAGQSIVSILPQGSLLQAQLLVPSSAIGFVHPGTPVVLHYQAFPYQKFGVQHGTVVEVSHDALTQAEITNLMGQQAPATSLYRVDVRLARQSIMAYGNQKALIPGMALNADLLLDRRRLIEWIFEPLYGMAKRSGGRS